MLGDCRQDVNREAVCLRGSLTDEVWSIALASRLFLGFPSRDSRMLLATLYGIMWQVANDTVDKSQ